LFYPGKEEKEVRHKKPSFILARCVY
jgi:hypothetical protein